MNYVPKTLFSKFFAIIEAVLLGAMICIAVFSFNFLGRYVISNQASSFQETAERLSQMTAMALENSGETAEAFLQFNITSVSDFSKCSVSIIDSSRQIFREQLPDPSGISVKALDDTLLTNILSGENYQYIGKIPKADNQLALVVSSPIFYRGQAIGASVITVPMPQVQHARYEIMTVMMWFFILSMLLATIVSFFLARHIIKPVRQLNAAAKSIADGDFKMRVSEEAAGELGELTQTFNKMTESLENLENMRSSFISNVSHELRTPMTTITGFIEGILDGTVPEERQKEYLEIVLGESRRLSKLVSGLLLSSRIEQGKMPEMKPFDFTESMRVGIIQFEKALTEKRIEVSANFETDPMCAYGDRDSIRQVITNLLDNAVKFTPAEGKIQIDMKKKGALIYTSVTNSGPGIPPEDLSRIWERFYKTDKSRSEDKAGVGLGLSLVKAILTQHGQTIEAESTPGEFTRFTFTLKAAE